MATLRELKGRIGSVSSTEKITGAMKMISSAKMHKAEGALKRLVPFRSQIQTIIGHLLSTDGEFNSPLTDVRDVKTLAIVVFGSDDGLCGAYNIQIFKELINRIIAAREKYGEDLLIVLYPVGSKIMKSVKHITDEKTFVVTDEGMNTRSDFNQIRKFTENLKSKFVSGEVDRIDLLYTHFKSVSRQTIENDTLLPVSHEALSGESSNIESNRPYLFEPDANAIFNTVLPMYILSVVQEVAAENNASEQAARVMAMQSANDNAKNLLGDLQLVYNKLRQQSITTELLDILGGQTER